MKTCAHFLRTVTELNKHMFWAQYALSICSAVCEINRLHFFTCFQISRMLAAKAALATRVDALGEDCSLDLGAEHKVKVEARIRLLEEGNLRRISGTGKTKAKFEKYHGKR